MSPTKRRANLEAQVVNVDAAMAHCLAPFHFAADNLNLGLALPNYRVSLRILSTTQALATNELESMGLIQ